MTYNELLLKLNEFGLDKSKKNNADYSIILLHNIINELLITEEKLNYLLKDLDKNFYEFNILTNKHTNLKELLVNEYNKLRKFDNLIDKKLINKKCTGIKDYISVIIINSLKNIYGVNFYHEFNDFVGYDYFYNGNELEVDLLDELPSYYNKIFIEKENVSVNLKNYLMELKLYSDVFKSNGIRGTTRLYIINSMINKYKAKEDFEQIKKELINILEMYYEESNNDLVKEEYDILDLYKKLTNRGNLEKYMPLFISLSGSELDEYISHESFYILIAKFIESLYDKDFLRNITYQEDGKIYFKDLKKMFGKMIKKLKKEDNFFNQKLLIDDVLDEIEEDYLNNDIKKL